MIWLRQTLITMILPNWRTRNKVRVIQCKYKCSLLSGGGHFLLGEGMLVRIQLMKKATMDWGGWDIGMVKVAPYYTKALGRYHDIEGQFSMDDCINAGLEYLKKIQGQDATCEAFTLARLDVGGAVIYRSYKIK